MERNLDRLTILMGLIFTFLTVILTFVIDSP
jgi:preprotein translocase subunit SecG